MYLAQSGSHMIAIQVLIYQASSYDIATSHDQVFAICNFPCHIPIDKIYGKLT